MLSRNVKYVLKNSCCAIELINILSLLASSLVLGPSFGLTSLATEPSFDLRLCVRTKP